MSDITVGARIRDRESGEIFAITAISRFMISYENGDASGEVRADALHSEFELIDEAANDHS